MLKRLVNLRGRPKPRLESTPTMETLTDAEKATLSQLQAIMNEGDVDTQISLLQSVDWDLQVGS